VHAGNPPKLQAQCGGAQLATACWGGWGHAGAHQGGPGKGGGGSSTTTPACPMALQAAWVLGAGAGPTGVCPPQLVWHVVPLSVFAKEENHQKPIQHLQHVRSPKHPHKENIIIRLTTQNPKHHNTTSVEAPTTNAPIMPPKRLFCQLHLAGRQRTHLYVFFRDYYYGMRIFDKCQDCIVSILSTSVYMIILLFTACESPSLISPQLNTLMLVLSKHVLLYALYLQIRKDTY